MTFDTLIIGAGQASTPLATALADKGQSVAIAEKNHLGGSCVNFGCTPSKAVLASARLAHQLRHAADFGIEVEGFQIHFEQVLAKAKAFSQESRNHLAKTFENDAITLLRGHAQIQGKTADGFEIRVAEQTHSAKHLVLDTGTHSFVPDIKGLETLDYLSAENWLDHTALPEHLLILGAGYIGIEFAQFYRRMGARVTVLEPETQILSHEDKDVAEALRHVLEEEGVTFILDAQSKEIKMQEGELELTYQTADKNKSITGSHLFVATGRAPNTDALGLETIKLNQDKKGFVEVNAYLASNVKNVYAVGDLRAGPMFTHTAYDDYMIVRDQILGEKGRSTDRLVPYAIFTDPELARVGLSEKAAKGAKKDFETLFYSMASNGRARVERATKGFIKVLVEKESGKILGATILASRASEIVHSYVDLMTAGASIEVLQKAIHIHPTFAESIKTVVM
ncbi:MAG: FAD-dependent oxidoreductase [Trueperaceae bacterium]|nr:FAD-dependent oxidoreductase [Trueperaceae bacterium]